MTQTENTSLTPRYNRALSFAEEAHRGQTRKGTPVPYVSHVLAVSSLVLEHGGDEDQAIAGLLHDVIEDCGGLPMERRIRSEFGPRVTDLVVACTDAWEEPKPDWRPRKEAWLESLNEVPAEALLVIGADKLHNAGATLEDVRRDGAAIFDRFAGGEAGTLWYYERVSTILDNRLSGTLPAILARTVAELRETATRHKN